MRGTDLMPLAVAAPPSTIGFSTPSLSSADGRTTYLAYTFVDPSVSTTHTLQCLRFVPGNVSSAMPCIPDQAASSFVTDAIIAAVDQGTTLYWRDSQYRVTLTGEPGASTPFFTLPDDILTVRRTTIQGLFFALVVKVNVMDARIRWRLTLGAFDPSSSKVINTYANKTIESIPDVLLVQGHLLYCSYDGTTLALQKYAIPTNPMSKDDLEQPIGAPIPIDRLSSAPVRSCRLAAGTNNVGVAWQESAPNDQVRTYLRVLPLDGL
jgi:hypothetical protein